ncbi:MAG: hypothetical protein MJ246_03700, partial [Clostridia bacterium]|nr:hypothetical protein [Clostridia bacterium]
IEETGIEPKTTFEENELKLEILKQQLCLKDSTMKVLDHIDEIYEFHNVGCVEIVGNEYMDYYTKYNKPIVEETCEEETEEEI